jgi:hypothetical protein
LTHETQIDPAAGSRRRKEFFRKEQVKKPWNEQQALVTGGASGIGLAIAKKLHGLGVKLALCDCDVKKLETARASVGENCRTVCVDVSDLKAVEAAFGKLTQQTGVIDILVNSAGITGITNVMSHEVPPAEVDLVFRVNFFGSFHTSRALLLCSFRPSGSIARGSLPQDCCQEIFMPRHCLRSWSLLHWGKTRSRSLGLIILTEHWSKCPHKS